MNSSQEFIVVRLENLKLLQSGCRYIRDSVLSHSSKATVELRGVTCLRAQVVSERLLGLPHLH